MEKTFKSKFGNKISIQNSFEKPDRSVWYTLMCECGTPEHAITIEMEFDKELKTLILHLYKEVEYACHYFFDGDTFLENVVELWRTLIRRIKGCFILLFTGHLKMSDDFIIQDKETINDFIEALEEAKGYCLNETCIGNQNETKR